MANLLPDIPGWASYKVHTGVKVLPGINRQFFQYHPGGIIDVDEREQMHRKIYEIRVARKIRETQKVISQCLGCGARKSEFRNGRTICSYCKGEL
jgi:hypothetical protein